ncbi:MAG: hypothetical protein KUG75_12235 [Pseudomonadales bacterium]|nr:hypothetical protein [Pseudomonadales bacterium]
MLMNLSENILVLFFCLLTSSFAIFAWVRAIIAEKKTNQLSEQLALYVEASINMSLHLGKQAKALAPSNPQSTRRHILGQVQACIKNGLAPSDIQVNFGLRDDEMNLVRALPRSDKAGLKRKKNPEMSVVAAAEV